MLKPELQTAGRIVVFAAVLCLFFLPVANAQHLNFHNYDHRDGLPQLQVLSVKQDSRGYIWIGTHAGAARYNGSSFEVFDTTSGLGGNTILTIAEDAKGNMLFGTHGGGLSIFDGSRMTTLGRKDGLPSERVSDILVEEQSAWLATGGGIVRFSGSELTIYSIAEEYGVHDYFTLRRVGDVLWVGTDVGAFRFEDDEFHPVNFRQELFDPRVNFFFPDGDGLYVGTNSGLFRVEGDISYQVHIPGFSDLARFLSVICHSENSEIWFGTDIGAVRLKDGEYSIVTFENGLPDTTINDICLDAELNVWFGTNNGLGKLRPGAFVYFDSENGLAGRSAVDIFEDNIGRVWICSGKGGLAVIEDGRTWTLTDRDGLPNPYVYGVGEAADGKIIIGTRDSVCSWDGETVRTVRDMTAVTTVFTDQDGRVWIGSREGMLVYENGVIRRPFEGHTEIDPPVYCINQAPNGDLWFGTRSDGVYVYDDKEVQFYNESSGFTNLDVWSIDFDVSGNAWLGTNGDGVFQYDGENFNRISVDDGLSNNFVWQVLADNDGSLWFGTNSGLDHYSDGKFKLYTVDDGLVVDEGAVNAVLQDSKGRRWFGSHLGASMYVGDPLSHYVFNPAIVIEHLSVNEMLLDPTNRPQLNSDQNNVHLQFSALSFRNEHAILYSHRLEGRDSDWSAPSQLHITNYTNLPPNQYTFKVRAIYRGMRSPNVAEISFVVNEPFYRSFWFLVLLVLLFAAGLAYIYHSRTSTINREKMELDLKVRERTSELIQANAELETFNAAVSNNLKVPLRHIEGFCEVILQEEGEQLSPKVRDLIERIDSSTQRTNQMINDLMRLSLAGSLEMKPSELDLSLFARVTAREMQKEEPERSVQFRIEEDIHVVGSERLLWMVLENLLSNAWKATHVRDNAVIEFGVEIVNEERHFYVKDNGMGLDVDMMDKLFHPFALLHHPDEFPGSGLGLVTVRRIIIRHRGRIWAESVENAGSTFYFTLGTETD